jgi:hypothetical protein
MMRGPQAARPAFRAGRVARGYPGAQQRRNMKMIPGMIAKRKPMMMITISPVE